MRVCSVVSLDEREARAPLRRQLSVDEERGCGGHWAAGAPGPEARRGLTLYRAFLLDALARARLRPPACALLPATSGGSRWERWWEARALATATRRFSGTPRRAALRVRAASVQLAALDYPGFQHIMQTLFQEGGASLERVLALFCFLGDLACAALRGGLRAHFCRVTHWAARHIADCGTPWVARHGGWGRVLRARRAAPEAAALAALAAACALAALLLYRALQRPPTRPGLLPA